MRISFICIVIAVFQPYLWTFLAKLGGSKDGVVYDNTQPRVSLAQLHGWPLRASWAQQNSFEALPVFVAAVLMAHVAQVPTTLIDTCAVVFVLLRFVYFGCYVANWATLRSLVWLIGILVCLRLMVAAI